MAFIEIVNQADNLEIIQQVEQFYNSAWNKLIITGSVVFVIIGIAVPIFTYYMKKGALKIQKDKILAEIDEKLKEEKKKLREEIKKGYEKELSKLKSELDKEIKLVRGFTGHLQASASYDQKNYIEAVKDMLTSLEFYLHANSISNVQVAYDLLIEKIFKFISKKDVENIFTMLDTTLEEYFSDLKKQSNNDLTDRLIIELKTEMKKIK